MSDRRFGSRPPRQPRRLPAARDGTTGMVSKAQVRDMIRSSVYQENETKFFTTSISTTISNAIGLNDLALIPEGTTFITRVGGSITATEIEMNGIITVGDATNVVRLLMFWWKPNTTTDVPSLGELFADGTNPTVSPPLVLFEPLQFTVVWDQIIVVDTAESIRKFRVKIPLKQKSSYNAGVNTGSNHLYLATVSDSVAVTHPGILAVATLKYHDA